MGESTTAARGTFPAEVLTNRRVCDEHYRMALAVPSLPPSRPGQFVQLLCGPPGARHRARQADRTPAGVPVFTQRELTEHRPLLRRPMSLASRRDGPGRSVEIEVIYRTVGVGTRWLAHLECGAVLSVLGPLGTPFALDADKPAAVLVGGGVGIPPLLYLARALAEAGKAVTAFAGARTAALLPLDLAAEGPRSDGRPNLCAAELAETGAETALATDDGSLGFAGLVTAPLVNWLDGRPDPAAEVKVYTCGPEAMMRAVAGQCARRGVACEVSLERTMGCGMGTCQSCICKVRTAPGDDWAYKLCCTDGPVFDAAEIVWD